MLAASVWGSQPTRRTGPLLCIWVDARRFCLGVASSASNALILAAQRSYSKARRADARRSCSGVALSANNA
jgi:hypothetical protein